jgi:hypothetical protein
VFQLHALNLIPGHGHGHGEQQEILHLINIYSINDETMERHSINIYSINNETIERQAPNADR